MHDGSVEYNDNWCAPDDDVMLDLRKSYRELESWLTSFRGSYYNAGEARARAGLDEPDLDERNRIARDLRLIRDCRIALVGENCAEYPRRAADLLGEKRPGLLFMSGNTTLLDRPAVFVCGSRNTSQAGRDIAYRIGRLVAGAGYVVISGFARGIDAEAHRGALEGGGETIAVLPYGLGRFRAGKDFADIIEEDNFLALSELPPSCGFITKGALRRNRLMVSLAGAVVVVEPGESGGTWYSASQAALLGIPLFYHGGERRETETRLDKMGGKKISLRKDTPVLDDVFACIENQSD